MEINGGINVINEQTLYCHECDRMLRFKTKPEKSGNLIIVCDVCGHQHCRRVVNGEVMSDRWDRRYKKANIIHGVESNSF